MSKLIEQELFMKKYNIKKETYERANINWSALEEIYFIYSQSRSQLEPTARSIADFFSSHEKVHSVKFRIKDPEHLIEKIIRKRSLGREIDISNFTHEITDLIGIRILHLFKEDWESIHDHILAQWTLQETPRANIREGDLKSKYEEKNCEIIIHPKGYRSVHYLINSNLTIKKNISEIQVRTIFEEAWSEIDHKIRYPYNVEDRLLTEYLEIFNRLSGSADEMGSFINKLRKNFSTTNRDYTDKMSEKDKVINELKSEIERLKSEKLEIINYVSGIKTNTIVEHDLDNILKKDLSLENLFSYITISRIPEQLQEISLISGFRNEEDSWEEIEILSYLEIIEVKDILVFNTILESSLNTIGEFYTDLINHSKNGWSSSKYFNLILVIIATFPDKFSAEILETLGWDNDLAERVIECANKYNVNKKRK